MKAGIAWAALVSLSGLATLTYSPVPCACERLWQSVYAAAGFPTEYPYRYRLPKDLEQGLNAHLQGKPVRGSSSYFFDACKVSSPVAFRCVLETEESGPNRRGYLVDITVDKAGKFLRAKVESHASSR